LDLTLSFSEQLLKFLPRPVRFFTEDDDFVLPFVKVETEPSFNVAFPGTIVSGGDVIYVDQKSATLGMGEVNEFHPVLPHKRSAEQTHQLAAGNSR
jgi:hypothetical protein